MASNRRAACLALGALLLLAYPARGLGLIAETPGQDSSISIDPDGLGLAGSAKGGAAGFIDQNGLQHIGRSLFSIDFRIDGQGSVELDGCFDTSRDAVPGSASVELSAGDQILFSQERSPYFPCEWDPFHFDADLAAGAYTLQAVAEASYDSSAHFDLTFHVTDTVPIPEPAAFGLVAAGLAGIGARAQRRSRSR